MAFLRTASLLALAACAVTATYQGEPTVVAGTPFPNIGVYVDGAFSLVGYTVQFLQDDGTPGTESGHYLTHTCDPSAPGAYYAVYESVFTALSADGLSVVSTSPTTLYCEHGHFSYAADGSLQVTFTAVPADVTTYCPSVEMDPTAFKTSTRLAALPGTPTGEFCGLVVS
eukprot:TRINITY_DN642_c0_g1_i3.p2 TRINITY_DN642_c0_g1~~TRINITY_DN642_c0_g1_i3.p2  ORF type:complete len:170 (-),score=22.65 TRINITY_DN642_c0_g1_i3:440-949(-)